MKELILLFVFVIVSILFTGIFFFALMPVITLFVFILGIMFIFIQGKKKYPIIVRIYEDRAGKGVKESNDRAGKIFDKKTGKTAYLLKKRKVIIPEVNYNDLIPSDKSVVLLIHAYAPDDLSPMKFNVLPNTDKTKNYFVDVKGTDEQGEEGIEFVAEREREIARKQIYVSMNEHLWTKFQDKSFLDRFMPIFLLIIFAMSIAIIMYAANQGLTESIGSLSNSIAELRKITDSLAVVSQPPY